MPQLIRKVLMYCAFAYAEMHRRRAYGCACFYDVRRYQLGSVLAKFI